MDVREMERIWQQVACFLLCDTVTEAMETVLRDAGFSWDESLNLQDAPEELLRRKLALGASNEERGEREGFDLYYVDEDGRMVMQEEQEVTKEKIHPEDPVEGAMAPTSARTAPPVRCLSSSMSIGKISEPDTSKSPGGPTGLDEPQPFTADSTYRPKARLQREHEDGTLGGLPEACTHEINSEFVADSGGTQMSPLEAPLRNITNGTDHGIEESNTTMPICTRDHKLARLNSAEDLHRGIGRAVRHESNRALWKRILLFQAADIREIQEAVQSAGLKCPLNQLAGYLNGEGIPYTRTRARPAGLSIRAKRGRK